MSFVLYPKVFVDITGELKSWQPHIILRRQVENNVWPEHHVYKHVLFVFYSHVSSPYHSTEEPGSKFGRLQWQIFHVIFMKQETILFILSQ
jgi:hypothetical protein